MDAFHNIVTLIDKRGNKLGRIDITTAHLKEMRIALAEYIFNKFLRIINLADCRNSESAVMRAHDQRLWFII